MKRGAPLVRSPAPKRKKRIRNVSAKARVASKKLEGARELVEKRAGWVCERCARGWGTKLQIHHIVPRSHGRGWDGLNKPENLALLCHRCHHEIHVGCPPDRDLWIRSRKGTKA